MITRININGFKSLLNTKVFLGPFTCIVGENAIGKSNFFDALMFLSKLADHSILEAAMSIRSENKKHSNIKDIFYRSGSDYIDTMSFEVDMIIPQQAEDDLGQMAEATITSLKYILELKINNDSEDKQLIEISREELLPVTLGNTKNNIFFNKSSQWIDSILNGRRSTKNPFISTIEGIIKLHSDSTEKKRGGRTTEFFAEKMPRTLLSTVTSESPTAFLARHEMRSWTMLQFEPSALRQPNSIYEVKNAEIQASGLNLPATLFRLHSQKKDKDIYQSLTNKIKGLVNEIQEIFVDKDEKRDLLTLQVKFKDNLILPAQSLSDGTLRFLGLAILEEDNQYGGVICLEEPENGINPKKIETMVELLEDMTTDTDYEVDEDNPLRQVIINSHSPIVVNTVSSESLYLIKEKEAYLETFGRKVRYSSFSALKNTWKTNNHLVDVTSLGEIISYLEQSERINFFSEPNNEYFRAPEKIQKSKTVGEHVKQLKLDLK